MRRDFTDEDDNSAVLRQRTAKSKHLLLTGRIVATLIADDRVEAELRFGSRIVRTVLREQPCSLKGRNQLGICTSTR